MKDLSKTLIVKELINTLSLVKKQPFYLVMAAIIDALFFLAWGFFTGPVRDKIVQHSILIANKINTLFQGGKLPTGLLAHLFTPEFKPLTGKLIILICLLFVLIFLVYTIFHGTAWWMATKMAGTKWTYRKYMLGFARVNLIWIAGYIIYKLLDIMISLRHLFIEKLLPGTTNIAGSVLFILLILLGIAAFLSYPRLLAGTIFTTPLKISIPLVILSASIFLAVQFILKSIGKVSVDAALIIGLLLLFPTMSFIRVYAIRVLSHVHTRT